MKPADERCPRERNSSGRRITTERRQAYARRCRRARRSGSSGGKQRQRQSERATVCVAVPPAQNTSGAAESSSACAGQTHSDAHHQQGGCRKDESEQGENREVTVAGRERASAGLVLCPSDLSAGAAGCARCRRGSGCSSRQSLRRKIGSLGREREREWNLRRDLNNRQTSVRSLPSLLLSFSPSLLLSLSLFFARCVSA